MATGSFDILHPGHIYYLSKAKALGSRLIVVVARDSSIELFKKRKPLFNETERAELLGSLKMVDIAVLGNRISGREGIFSIIRKYRPDIIAMGYDQKPGAGRLRRWLKENGINAKVVRISCSPHKRRNKSSFIRKIIEGRSQGKLF